MSRILISGLTNLETTLRVRQFPLEYYPVDYPFFGVQSAVSGVGYNVAKAMKTLGDEVVLLSMTGKDFPASYIREELTALGIDTAYIKDCLAQTPASVVLYEESGRRQIHCDLKDLQETAYGFPEDICRGMDLVVATNTNFNRELLHLAKTAGVCVATDVHVLTDLYDGYNRDFLENADILFLSDEGIGEDYRDFLWTLADTYPAQVIVLGRGGKGAAMYLRRENRIVEQEAVCVGQVVNTVGAGDALFSAFCHYLAKGLEELEALERAQIFAAAKIRTSGAGQGFITEAELEYFRKHL